MKTFQNTIKKLSLFLLTFTLILFSSYTVASAQNISNHFTREAAVKHLVNSGMEYKEIKNMTDEELEIFYKADQISIDKKCYYVPENESETPVLVEDDDILNAIAEQENQKNSSRNIHSSTDTQISGDGYLEQYIYIANSASNSNQYYISYRAEWLKQPANRKMDVFGVTVSNATVVPDSINANHHWTIDRYYNSYQPNWKSGDVNLFKNSTYTPQGVAVKCDLMTDTADGIQRVSAQNMSLKFYVTKDNPNIKTIAAAGIYLHQKSIIAVSPSITAISVSAGISVTHSNSFTTMIPIPIQFYLNETKNSISISEISGNEIHTNNKNIKIQWLITGFLLIFIFLLNLNSGFLSERKKYMDSKGIKIQLFGTDLLLSSLFFVNLDAGPVYEGIGLFVFLFGVLISVIGFFRK